jgi:hypothetical protein
MKRNHIWACAFFVLLCAANASASVFGDVRGIVYDPHQDPVKGASLTLRARATAFSQTIQTNDVGIFFFRAQAYQQVNAVPRLDGDVPTGQGRTHCQRSEEQRQHKSSTHSRIPLKS